jgi:hypothetical protein
MLENTTFQKLDLFQSSGEGRETLTLLGPLERASLNHWTGETGATDPVSETLCSLVFRIPDDGKSPEIQSF